MKKLTAIADFKLGVGIPNFLNNKEFRDNLKLCDGRYIVTFEKAYRKRSNSQNSSIWAVPYVLIQNALIAEGYEEAKGEKGKLYVHEICKENCLPVEYVDQLKEEHKEKCLISKNSGQIISMPFRLTTKKMTTVQCMEYYSNLQNFGYEFFSIEIPDPEKNYKINL